MPIYLSFAPGLLFSFNFIVVYTSARTLGTAYHYNALQIGFVLVSFGAGEYALLNLERVTHSRLIGSMCGSILGGRYSDHVLAKRKAAAGGVRKPEVNNDNADYFASSHSNSHLDALI